MFGGHYLHNFVRVWCEDLDDTLSRIFLSYQHVAWGFWAGSLANVLGEDLESISWFTL